jgi:SAM-dependent MidA family methyltransferase
LRLADRIAQSPTGQISFADYMDMALYDPQGGYYATRTDRSIGAGGDFFTSPHLGADFGELVAVQVAEIWEILGQPDPFDVVELGAGQGILAADVLGGLAQVAPACAATVRYTIVERAAAAIAAQRHQLAPWMARGAKVTWRSLDQIPLDTWEGCCLSNELVDALPVHRVIWQGGELQEIYVTLAGDRLAQARHNLDDLAPQLPPPLPPPARPLGAAAQSALTGIGIPGWPQPSADGGGDLSEDRDTHHGTTHHPSPTSAPEAWLTEAIAPLSTPRIADYFRTVGIDWSAGPYPEGYRTEVNLAATDWMAAIAARLRRGYVITIDYGYPAHRYYQPARREGTLQCYWQHTHSDDPYIDPGLRDITAHVDFTALERYGDRAGLATCGFMPQGLFLMALGLGDRIAALSYPDSAWPEQARSLPAILRRRAALHQLMDPMGLGNFGVLIQSKGLSKDERSRPLRGLTDPSRPLI